MWLGTIDRAVGFLTVNGESFGGVGGELGHSNVLIPISLLTAGIGFQHILQRTIIRSFGLDVVK